MASNEPPATRDEPPDGPAADPSAPGYVTQEVTRPDPLAPTLPDAPTVDRPASVPLPSTVADPGAEGAAAAGTAAGRAVADGRFRVVRLHARGGLGQVSRAWDAQLGRQVALKEMRPDQADNEEQRARFILEAEINGNLEHPGIVPVYALGSFPDGRPYYAMRFVEGRTLQQAIDKFHKEAPRLPQAEWTLGLRRLLGHFLDVCDAIAYAHSRGVLHRDIKPANVLLGPFGETHIIDWGLAKATGRPEPGREADPGAAEAVLRTTIGGAVPTMAGRVFGSPPYMSPEQADGHFDDLDHTSDVYSLGATLYALLTGRHPVTEEKARAALELVRRGAIAPPRTVNARVPPALEAICRKAMRLEPARRYPSATALADDLRRWMADEPVAVHPESPATRALRWARHHKPLVVGTAALVLTALVALTISTVVVSQQRDAARRARDETAAALREAREARRLAEYHALNGVRLINELVTLGDRQLVNTAVSAGRREQLLSSALHFIRAIREGQPDDVGIQVQSAVIARRLAHLYAVVGDFDRAELFFAESIAAVEQLARRDPRSAPQRDLVAQALIDQAELWKHRGRVRDARGPLDRAVAIARRVAGEEPEDPTYRWTLARGLARSSEVLRKLGDPAAAGPAEEAARLLEPIAAARLGEVGAAVRREGVAAMMDQLEWVTALVFLAEARGGPAAAADPLRRAADRMDELDRLFRGDSVPDLDYFHAWTDLAFANLLGDDPAHRDEAARRLDDAIDRLTRLVADNRDYLHFRFTLAEARAARARRRAAAGRPQVAAEDAVAARGLLRELVADHPRVPDYVSLLGAVEETLGALARDDGRAGEAREHFGAAIRLQEEALAINPDDPLYARRRRAAGAALDAPGPPKSEEPRPSSDEGRGSG
jgi:serine/threonine-protein kinase